MQPDGGQANCGATRMPDRVDSSLAYMNSEVAYGHDTLENVSHSNILSTTQQDPAISETWLSKLGQPLMNNS